MEDRQFTPGVIVKHFKRSFIENPKNEYLYRIVAEATHSETGEQFVVYRSLETDKVYVRPAAMFYSEVDAAKYPYCPQRYRFEYFM